MKRPVCGCCNTAISDRLWNFIKWSRRYYDEHELEDDSQFPQMSPIHQAAFMAEVRKRGLRLTSDGVLTDPEMH